MATVIKAAHTSCPCGFRGELCFYARDNFQAPCPKCGKTLAPGGSVERTYGNRRFSGDGAVSVTEGFRPAEVAGARRLMPKSADCIRADGTVVFTDSHSEKTFHKELRKAKESIGVGSGMTDNHQPNPDQQARLREIGIGQ